MTIELDKLFAPKNKSVLEFFQAAGVGYLIPEYQREYSWDKENIDQLLKDISLGVERLTDNKIADEEIRFLGTIITVSEKQGNNKDPKGEPTRIDMIIDGQQRIITISILASLFIKILIKIRSSVNEKSDIYEDIEETVGLWCNKIIDCICFDLNIGKPKFKPRLIRGGRDYWTAYGKIQDAYSSDIAKYQAEFINSYIESEKASKISFPVFSGQEIYRQNYRRIEKWLTKVVGEAHLNDNDDFPTAKKIIDSIPQNLLWQVERPIFSDMIKLQGSGKETKDTDIVCNLVQTLAACYYLLERCCFCVIRPTNEDWAFDMFQSLNATGTPLTAIETFKPIVLNHLKTKKIEYSGSVTETYFKKVEEFLGAPNTAVGKTKRTNDFITSFFIAYNGEKVPTHFSGERRALVDNFNLLKEDSVKEAFIKKMGDYASFYDLWLKYEGKSMFKLNTMHEESSLISMLVLFLKISNHKMAITTLGSVYQEILDNKTDGDQKFVDTVKATAAFYFLWRTAFPNNGLDVAYRNFFQTSFNDNEVVSSMRIKKYFFDTITSKTNLNDWKQRACQTLKYGKLSNEFIRFALLLTFTDTIADSSIRGLIKLGKPGTSNYLTLKHWSSEDLKSIEHIAPQSNNAYWDETLYDQETMYVNTLGNLTLLPTSLNSSASNKGLQEKLLYYKCVGEEDEAEINVIENKANKLGIQLASSTIGLLKSCHFSQHIAPISKLDFSDSWKANLVKQRTNAMLEIIWNKLISWLQ